MWISDGTFVFFVTFVLTGDPGTIPPARIFHLSPGCTRGHPAETYTWSFWGLWLKTNFFGVWWCANSSLPHVSFSRSTLLCFEPIPAQSKLTKIHLTFSCHCTTAESLNRIWRCGFAVLFCKAWIFPSCALIILVWVSHTAHLQGLQPSRTAGNSHLNLLFFKCKILKQRYRFGMQAY